MKTTSLESTSVTTTYHRMTVDGVGIFYREAGPKNAPMIVLLHGFPSSSREFDTLIPLLATRYHLLAPDFPGFGQSDAPLPSSYRTSLTIWPDIRVADIQACYELWRSRGAEFITEPKQKYGETRCYIRDPDGYIIEVGQSNPGIAYG